jgi:hypothetical protein
MRLCNFILIYLTALVIRPVVFRDSVIFKVNVSIAQQKTNGLCKCRDVEVEKFINHYAESNVTGKL